MDIVERLQSDCEEGADPDLIYAAANEIERLRKVLKSLSKVKHLYSTYASGNSVKSYGQMIDEVLTPYAALMGRASAACEGPLEGTVMPRKDRHG